MNTENPPLPADDQKMINRLALNQLWGFVCPGINILAPFLYRTRHKSNSPEVRKVYCSILNLQISWSVYLFFPIIFLHRVISQIDVFSLLEDLKSISDPYSYRIVDTWQVMETAQSLVLILMAEFILTLVWVAVTTKSIMEYKKGHINHRGMLSLPLFR